MLWRVGTARPQAARCQQQPSRRANSMHNLSRIAIVGVVAMIAATTAAPAFAGQAFTAPGFPSGSASCVGAAMNFQAHYGGENDTFPVVTHGTVGPNMSGHATTDGPGAVGAFESSLAQSSGPVWVCLP